ncbi:hypothetical protein AGMMS49525_15170 [Bacteroidia bacterium]|nr:hypothetical protein AGMMS49525_15170 [Bacteroidia bacterium]
MRKANWPVKDSVDFFAYSPASSVNVTTGLKQAPSVTIPPATGPEIKYTVPGWNGVDQQEDFMVTKSVDLTFASSPTVQLNFKHALSRIVFKAQNQNKNKTYLIKELALSKLKSKGTLNILDSVPNAALSLYGTVAEVATTPADATYLYATIVEVDYLTNDTVNKRQVVFRLHDPANKAQGIVFEAGRQYTFLLTLGLDGAEIAFSIPAVADFNRKESVGIITSGRKLMPHVKLLGLIGQCQPNLSGLPLRMHLGRLSRVPALRVRLGACVAQLKIIVPNAAPLSRRQHIAYPTLPICFLWSESHDATVFAG